MSDKVLVVGFDGATFDIIKPLVADGRLPTLSRLLNNGAWGILRSTIPPITPLAWTSVITGKNGEKHGIHDFQHLNPKTYEFTTIRANDHREKTIWQLLGEVGKRSIVMDVPFTYPPQPLNGLMITGYGTPGKYTNNFTYPNNFTEILPERFHEEIRVALPTHKFDRSQAFIDDWEDVMAGRSKLLTYLIEHEAWDFFMAVFSITDHMAHVFWTYIDPAHPNYYRPEGETYREAFFHSYELCDHLLGKLMDKAGSNTTTLVISDHGFGSIPPAQYIYHRLLKGGYIALKDANDRIPLKAQIAKTMLNTYQRFPFLREWVKGLHPDSRNALKKSLNQAGIMPKSRSLDFTKSKIIPTNIGVRMWVNDTERFATGIVPPFEKEALIQELSHFLLADRDKLTGKPIINKTFTASDLFTEPYSVQIPDLIIEFNNFYQPFNESNEQNPFLEGGHTMDGIFLSCGPHVTNTKVSGTTLIDLAPTILHIMGQAIPPDMDGRVIEEIFTQKYQKSNPVEIGNIPARHELVPGFNQGAISKEEDTEITEQLRQLGYIE